MNLQERIAKRDAVDMAADFEEEQKALEKACVIDMLPTIPKGAIDLFHQFKDSEALTDYSTICKELNLGFDRGAKRYCFNSAKISARKVYDKLIENGFTVAVRPGLLE